MQEKTLEWLRIGADSVTIEVTARPGSSRSAIIGAGPSGLVIAVHSPPADGRANAELIAIVADALSIPRSVITLQRGRRGRKKILRIAGSNPAAMAGQIARLAAGFRRD